MSLYRENVTPFPKVPAVKSCNRPLCNPTNQCVSCRNSTSRTKGLRAQRKAAKATKLGRTAFRGQQGNEENWRGAFRAEVKSGKQVNPFGTAFLIFEEQAEHARAIGDIRPFCAVVMPDEWGSDGIVMLRISTWRREIAPLLDEGAS